MRWKTGCLVADGPFELPAPVKVSPDLQMMPSEGDRQLHSNRETWWSEVGEGSEGQVEELENGREPVQWDKEKPLIMPQIGALAQAHDTTKGEECIHIRRSGGQGITNLWNPSMMSRRVRRIRGGFPPPTDLMLTKRYLHAH